MSKHRIFLIRHAQASWGKLNYDVLSSQGVQQSHVLGTYNKALPNAAIVAISGTMLRQKDTAKHCLQSMGIHPDVKHTEQWNEFNFKNVIEAYKPMYRSNGLMYADIKFRVNPAERFQKIFNQSIKDWVNGVDNKHYEETWLMFKARILGALDSLKEYDDSEDIFIFTSGGVIAVIACHLLGMDDQQWRTMSQRIANTSMTQIELDKQEFSLTTFNEHGHLKGDHKHLLSFH